MDILKLLQVRQASQSWLNDKYSIGSFDPDRMPGLQIAPSTTVKKIQACVSPDCSYRLVQEAVRSAKNEICFYIYNAGADHLLDLLREAKNRQVNIRIMVDVMDTRGGEREKLNALQVDLKEAPSSDGRRVFTVCHQKFAVIDESILLIGSANWAGTSIPLVTVPGKFKKGNREWITRIDDAPLALWFKGLFEADWNIPQLEGMADLFEENLPLPEATYAPALMAHLPDEVFDIQQVDLMEPVIVTPVISPDNYYDVVLEQIQKAVSSIYIEQQYILAGGPRTEGLLAALELRKESLDIRIIVSPAFRRVGALDNWELTVQSLDAFGLKGCLRAMNLTCYTHLHNKGVIFDRQKVLVSSTNWSENSISRAREAGVLIEEPAIAGYYARVFDFDWSIGWDPADVPANIVEIFKDAIFVPGGFEEIHPADLA